MKNIRIYFWMALVAVSLFSCEEVIDPVINTKALDGTLTFQLNQPQFSNWTYELKHENAALNMDSLTCVQPEYGFTAAVTYATQVSLSSTFAAGTYKELATTINGEKVAVNTKEVNKALIALNGGSFTEPLPSLTVYVRLKAIISDAVNNPVDNDTIVKPLFSNVITLKVKPYIEPLAPYYEVTLRPWYIIGLGNVWDNNTAGLGSSLIPLGVVAGNAYDAASGDGTFTYTGYFDAASGFKLIRDIGTWSPQWGMTDGTPTYGTGGNITVPTSGYYTLTLNSIDNKLTITAATAPTKDYTLIGLIGEFNGWASDLALTPNTNTQSHIWYVKHEFTANAASDGGCKFRANGGWDTNWGFGKFPAGVGVNNGANIPYKKGIYTIIFNDIDGSYYFIQ